MSYVPWYVCSLNFIRIIPDRLSYNGEGVFYTQRTRRKKIQGKKKKGEEQSGKDGKSGKKKDRKRTKSKMEKHKFSPTTSQAPGFLVCKKRTFPKKRSLISGMLILIISTGIIYPVRKQRLEIENPAAFASDFS